MSCLQRSCYNQALCSLNHLYPITHNIVFWRIPPHNLCLSVIPGWVIVMICNTLPFDLWSKIDIWVHHQKCFLPWPLDWLWRPVLCLFVDLIQTLRLSSLNFEQSTALLSYDNKLSCFSLWTLLLNCQYQARRTKKCIWNNWWWR